MRKWRNDLSQVKNKRRKAKLTERDTYNRKTLVDYRGYIFRQDAERIKDLRYGSKGLWYNGCGAVAAYNVMFTLGKRIDLCDILLDFELNRVGNLNAIFGTSSRRLPKFFTAHNIEFTTIKRLEEYIRRMGEFDISIIFIRAKNSPMLHYYCILKRGENDFVTINQHYQDTFGKPDWDNHFIKAFCFKK